MSISTVTVLGSSSGRNAGDAALVSGLMDSIDQAFGQKLLYEVPTIKPKYLYENYKNQTKAIGMMPWHASIKLLGLPTLQSMMRTDLTLIFDAVLFDRALWNPLFNFMSSIALMAPFAKKRGSLLGCYNVGLGPVTTAAGRSMLRSLLERMDFIAVREESSLELINELGVNNPNVILGADAALTVSGADKERVDQILANSGLPLNTEFLAINVNTYLNSWSGSNTPPLSRSDFVAYYGKAISEVAKKLQLPVLFVSTQYSDTKLTEDVKSQVKSPFPVAVVHNQNYSHYEIKGVLERVSLLFGMRLHSQILASSGLAPIIGLAFQSKVVHYYKTLGLSEYCLDFAKFSTNGLIDHMLHGWNDKHKIKQVLSNRIPELKQRALLLPKYIAALSKDKNLKVTDYCKSQGAIS